MLKSLGFPTGSSKKPLEGFKQETEMILTCAFKELFGCYVESGEEKVFWKHTFSLSQLLTKNDSRPPTSTVAKAFFWAEKQMPKSGYAGRVISLGWEDQPSCHF